MIGTVPSHWVKYKLPRGTSVGQFIADLVARLGQLESVASDPASRRAIWLGGLFQPEAYITATRQAIAHQKGWSLETLVMSLDLEESSGAEAFVVQGEFSGICLVCFADFQDSNSLVQPGQMDILYSPRVSLSSSRRRSLDGPREKARREHKGLRASKPQSMCPYTSTLIGVLCSSAWTWRRMRLVKMLSPSVVYA